MDTKRLDEFQSQGMSEEWKKNHLEGMDFQPSTAMVHSGFIAQEVAKAAKESGFVSTIVHVPANAEKESYGIDYEEIVVPLVKAVQEQQDMIDKLTSQVEALSTQVKTLGGTTATNNLSVQLGSAAATAVVLNQNVPNPFAEQTTITYNIPQSTNSAQVLFYDFNGQLIKTVDVKTRGAGQLTVFANDLTNGLYTYSLVIDGKVFDTKKMLKQN
jgi:hypothetical protein